jgi:hypothetical protein
MTKCISGGRIANVGLAGSPRDDVEYVLPGSLMPGMTVVGPLGGRTDVVAERRQQFYKDAT